MRNGLVRFPIVRIADMHMAGVKRITTDFENMVMFGLRNLYGDHAIHARSTDVTVHITLVVFAIAIT